MTKFSLALVSLLVLSVYGKPPDNYQLNQEQVLKYKTMAEQWKNVINFSKQPCDDFYNYVCTDYDYPSSMEEEGVSTGDYFKNFLVSYPQKISEAEEKFVKFQQTCKAISQQDKIQWIKNFNFPDTIGGWPAYTPNWQPNNFHLQAAIAEFTSYNHPVVFQQEFQTDTETFKNYYLITIEDVYDVSSNKDYLQDLLSSYEVINVEEIIQDALQYQKVYNDSIASVQASDIKTDYAGLKKLDPEIDWDHQISYVYGGQLALDYPVIVKSEEEITAAWNAIEKLSPKVIANYFFIKFITFENEVDYNQYVKLFKPVLKGVVKKYILNESLKQELEGMLISVLEVFQQAFGIFGTADVESKIQTFVNEKIFGAVNDVALNQEYQNIGTVTTPVECLKNFHYLQQLYKKRVAQRYFTEYYGKIYYLQKEIDTLLLNKVPKRIQYPSIFLYDSFIWELISTVVYGYKVPYSYTTAQKLCYAYQLNKEIADDQLNFILVNQIFTKAYYQWIKEYPSVVQVENNIFKDYELSAQKLLTIWVTKHACPDLKNSDDLLSVFWNLPEFSDTYECAPESKMNPVEKCSLW